MARNFPQISCLLTQLNIRNNVDIDLGRKILVPSCTVPCPHDIPKFLWSMLVITVYLAQRSIPTEDVANADLLLATMDFAEDNLSTLRFILFRF